MPGAPVRSRPAARHGFGQIIIKVVGNCVLGPVNTSEKIHCSFSASLPEASQATPRGGDEHRGPTEWVKGTWLTPKCAGQGQATQLSHSHTRGSPEGRRAPQLTPKCACQDRGYSTFTPTWRRIPRQCRWNFSLEVASLRLDARLEPSRE